MPGNERHPLEERIVQFVADQLGSVAASAHARSRNLPTVLWHVYATALSEAEIENGGFEQYFENLVGSFALRAVDGYQTIGAPRCRSAIEQGIKLFMVKNPKQRLFPFAEPWVWPRPFVEDPDFCTLDEQFFEAMRLDHSARLRRAFIERRKGEILRLMPKA